MKWFGFSNQRPQMGIEAIHGGDISPGWKSNNGFYPNRWQGVDPGYPRVAETPSAAQTY